MMPLAEALPILRRMSGRRALVVGDVMLDRRLEGRPVGPSAEAPIVNLLNVGATEALGGAANAAAGLTELGLEVELLGHLGADDDAAVVQRLSRERGIGHAGCATTTQAPTTVKTRIASGHHLVTRIDREGRCPPIDLASFVSFLESHQPHVVLLSDYDKGVLNDRNTPELLAQCRSRGIPALVDPKSSNRHRYTGAFAITPNISEFEALVGHEISSPRETAIEFRRSANLDVLVVTLGSDGAIMVDSGRAIVLPASRRNVFDVTGAGDTFAAVFAAMVAADADLETAVVVANLAAGVSVTRVGTSTVGIDDLRNAISPASGAPVLSAADAVDRVNTFRADGLSIVVTNGCFDLLHLGHLELLRAASAEGDVLIVAVNDDSSVRRLKGVTRPIVPFEDRAQILAGIRYVDLVVGFETDTPGELYRALRPDVLVKGDDYELDQIVGANEVLNRGGRVVRIPRSNGRSTTDLIESAGSAAKGRT